MEPLLIVLTADEAEALKLKDESCSVLVELGDEPSLGGGLDNLVPPTGKS